MKNRCEAYATGLIKIESLVFKCGHNFTSCKNFKKKKNRTGECFYFDIYHSNDPSETDCYSKQAQTDALEELSAKINEEIYMMNSEASKND